MKMPDKLTYKGFSGNIKYSKIDNVYYGEVNNIQNKYVLISYQGQNLRELKKDFKYAIDDYLSMIEQNNY